MDTCNLRRRNSIGLGPRRRCLLLRAHRSNPHIGWSRHVPDPSFLNQIQPTSRAFRGSLKSSPYVGMFRHSPATVQVFTSTTTSRDEFYKSQARKWLEEEIYLFLKSMPSSSKGKDGVRCLSELLDRRLPGGNDKYGSTMTSHPHGSLKVFQNLKAWFLHPFQEDDIDQNSWNIKSVRQEQMTLEDEASEGESESEDEEEDEEEEEEDDEYSNYSASDDQSYGETDKYGRNALDIGISSQAEAYYAHQVTNELTVNPDDHTTVLPSPSSSRLDYVITQMDIVRMHRNASRHLDVESIYKLPTVTFKDPKVKETKAASRTGEKSAEGWSWMFIPKDKSIEEESSIILGEDSLHESPEMEDSNVCVICMETFVDGNRLRVLPCDHSFHVGCIDRWLSGSCSFDDCHTAGCPTCKKRADTGLDASHLDGSVPSWAFARLGRSLARECSDC